MISANKNNTKTLEDVRNKLKLNQFQVTNILRDKHPHVYNFLIEKSLDVYGLRNKSAGLLSAGILAGSLLASSPTLGDGISADEIFNNIKNEQKDRIVLGPKLMANSLKSFLPKKPQVMSANNEKITESLVEQLTGIKARIVHEGEKLNTSYGYIGAEQHLRRYPGDSLHLHKENLEEGIAPGLGAWGYFAASQAELSKELEETERWYAVVQTLYLPDWEKRIKYLRDWYKYRKVLIINVENGNAVVAAIADSGPAAWTGKHFGGSPEVMEYLGGSRYKKGRVILLFVDDPESEVPLGPVKY